MLSIGRSASLLGALLLLSLPQTDAFAGECKPLLQRVDVYNTDLKKAIRDEPEDMPRQLQRYTHARESGDTAKADRIQKKIRAGYVGLKMIDPPLDVAHMHTDMIEFYRAGVAVLDAEDAGDENARRAAELETWVGLRKFFTNLRDLFAEHQCNEGDVEAINEHYLPKLDKYLAEMRQGAPPPAHY